MLFVTGVRSVTVGKGTNEGVRFPDRWDIGFLSLWVGEQLKVFTDLDRWCIHPVVTGVRPVM